MAGRRKPGLWVMEGNWSASVRDVRSVEPVLSALQGGRRAHHAKRHINDPDDLAQALKQWGQRQHDMFNIGYVALHGSPATVHIGRKSLDMCELGERLPPATLKRKALHFGSCSVLNIHYKRREALRKALGVKVISGFTTDVEWFESLAFELLLFDALTWYRRPSDAESYLKKTHSAFAKRLGFVMVRG
ncbi:hypothetical protein EV643_14119 [Kribbella sp. VKM Ac-2527]|uniref:Uncharacterized protein n=1 Tax=Kribbella caucasensis TaxID=2512215 RepID=A0A4R6J3V7_9ACTN|nr:hypothetical protein [Kribbella sp. VKM Ac-2527]TDO30044.1 hypothetical protein EV643_14119 [Kribbella sp. VKM Ac-2527]